MQSQILPTLPSLLESEQLGPTIKAWFERNKQTDFVSALDMFVDNTQRDIQALCHHNYQVRSDFEATIRVHCRVRRRRKQGVQWTAGGRGVSPAFCFLGVRWWAGRTGAGILEIGR